MGKVLKNLKTNGKNFKIKTLQQIQKDKNMEEKLLRIKNLNKMKNKKIEKQTKPNSKKSNNMKKLKQFKNKIHWKKIKKIWKKKMR